MQVMAAHTVGGKLPGHMEQFQVSVNWEPAFLLKNCLKSIVCSSGLGPLPWGTLEIACLSPQQIYHLPITHGAHLGSEISDKCSLTSSLLLEVYRWDKSKQTYGLVTILFWVFLGALGVSRHLCFNWYVRSSLLYHFLSKMPCPKCASCCMGT